MKTQAEIQKIISNALQQLDWEREPKGLYEPIGYTLAAGGKRVRPALLLMAYDLFDGQTDEAITAALAIEVFHNFTLLHDDVMDKADQRRGRPTVHVKWNENTAILSGDQMLIEAYGLLGKLSPENLKTTLPLFTQMAGEICEGQQYDVDFEHRDDVREEEYIEMIRLKTAVLLGTALKIGALMAHAPQTDANALYDFGINIGLAFQLQDDFLDVYGDEATFGKAIGGDILCNKKTYMLITAQKTAEGTTKAELDKWLACTEYDPKEKIHAVTAIYDRLAIGARCKERIAHYHEKAMQSLDRLTVEPTRTQELRILAQKLMGRDK